MSAEEKSEDYENQPVNVQNSTGPPIKRLGQVTEAMARSVSREIDDIRIQKLREEIISLNRRFFREVYQVNPDIQRKVNASKQSGIGLVVIKEYTIELEKWVKKNLEKLHDDTSSDPYKEGDIDRLLARDKMFTRLFKTQNWFPSKYGMKKNSRTRYLSSKRNSKKTKKYSCKCMKKYRK